MRNIELEQEPTKSDAFEVELHGFDQIPEADRTMKMRDLDAVWLGSNAYPIYITFGVIVVGLGLKVWQALICVLIGNLLWLYVGGASIGGIRSGLPTLTFTRAPFGVLGNRANGILAWVSSVAFEALNTVFGVLAISSLLPVLGWHHPGALGKVIALVLTFFFSAGIAVLGHATLVSVQRILAVVLTLTMAVVFFYTVGKVHLNVATHGAGSVGSVIALMCIGCAVIGGGGPISYLYNASDWARYMPSRTSTRRIVANVTLSGGLISVFLCVMGVLLSSRGNLSDPIGGVKPLVPEALFIIYALAALGGSVASNVVTFYGSGLTLQAVGVPLLRWRATLLDLAVSTLLTVYVIFISSSFTNDVNDFVALLPVWLAPFGGVWLADGLMRRWHYEAAGIHDVSPSSQYWGWKGINVPGMAALLVGVVVCLLCVNSPIYVGPISKALSGADLTWLLGLPVAGTAYWVFAHNAVRRTGRGLAAQPVDAPPEVAENVA